MFFTDKRQQFFRPLTSKYREQVIECLRNLYARLYSSLADYSRALSKEQILECFQEAVTRTAVLEEDGLEQDANPLIKSDREQAIWILNLLLENDWLECQVDEATWQSSYGFSRVGRLFVQPMVETASGKFRTRHRNTRNTRNALQSFLNQGEVYDLLDAYEFSERIVSDFSDVIAELDEKKRQLVKEVEAQQVVQRATDEFFDFMEKRFIPDLAVRLSADSVERYRDEIKTLINKAKRKDKSFKVKVEKELRKVAPELLTDHQSSLFLAILGAIDSRMHSASEIMLPALRQALHSFTRRADIIIRQLSFTSGGQRNQLLAICKEFSAKDKSQQDKLLGLTGEVLSPLMLGFVDPAALRLHALKDSRIVNSHAEEHGRPDKTTLRELFINQALEKAFLVNNQDLVDYIVNALSKGHRINTQNLPMQNAKELLLAVHAIEIGSAGQRHANFRFKVTPMGHTVHTDYFAQIDAFSIELQEIN